MINSTFFFWAFIVCSFIALVLLQGKVPDEVNSSNIWGFVVGMVGVVSIIVSRVLAWQEINGKGSGADTNSRG